MSSHRSFFVYEASPFLNGTVSYTHDAVGNRLSRTASTTFLRDFLPNQAQAYNQNDQLVGHTYDSNGNTTQSPAPKNSFTGTAGLQPAPDATDTYDFRNKLIRRQYSDGSTIDLEYNADILLISKTVGGQQTDFLQDTNNHTGYAQHTRRLVGWADELTSSPEG